MHDLALVGFLGLLLAAGARRPFLWVLAYTYVDIVSPQRLSYYLLNSVPVSLICVALAVAGWALVDDKRGVRPAPRQLMILLLLLWAGWTTLNADFPGPAAEKWGWVWKALAFAIFLPFTLRTRLRIEAQLLFMVLGAASIIIVGGVKTLASGGGYGALNLIIASNTGLYEGSTISTIAVAIVPVILWLSRSGTVFPPDWKVRLFAWALCFACLLIPVGTEARTGLLCIVMLALLVIRDSRRRILLLTLLGVVGLVAVPMLPKSFTQRMDTIKTYQADSSASTRLAVWAWTWNYVGEHPFGGGFEAYRQNKLTINKVVRATDGTTTEIATSQEFDKGRAYHSSYFEMLGEQGWPGFLLWISLHLIGTVRMEVVRRRYARAGPDDAWVRPLAIALQQAGLIYLTGSFFVGIAFQPFAFMLLGVQIGLDTMLAARRRLAARAPIGRTVGRPEEPALAGRRSAA